MKSHALYNQLVVIACLFLLSAAPLVFAAPGILNYQGTLTDDASQPVNGTKTMTFKIYGDIDAQTPLWTSTIQNVKVVNGVFSQNLGEQDPFPNGLFDDDSLFLGVTVGDGPEMVPKKRLTSVPYALNSAIPKGAIIMWSGAIDQIPAGWALCNGQNGTPDLRDRFVVGAGNTYSSGSKGGNASINLSHNHSISLDGNHQHFCNWDIYDHIGDDITDTVEDGDGNTPAGSDHGHRIQRYTDAAGAHGHGGATGYQLSSSQSILPPYYALCFIMKL